ncbi:MAG: hypothetical protein IKO40_08850 [Kiritimatiellae bacterium]|nr:hypothetical protein [Kiritimatiellia bacterium]
MQQVDLLLDRLELLVGDRLVWMLRHVLEAIHQRRDGIDHRAGQAGVAVHLDFLLRQKFLDPLRELGLHLRVLRRAARHRRALQVRELDHQQRQLAGAHVAPERRVLQAMRDRPARQLRRQAPEEPRQVGLRDHRGLDRLADLAVRRPDEFPARAVRAHFHQHGIGQVLAGELVDCLEGSLGLERRRLDLLALRLADLGFQQIRLQRLHFHRGILALVRLNQQHIQLLKKVLGNRRAAIRGRLRRHGRLWNAAAIRVGLHRSGLNRVRGDGRRIVAVDAR